MFTWGLELNKKTKDYLFLQPETYTKDSECFLSVIQLLWGQLCEFQGW